jgi:hydrogenase-4 component F
LADFNEGAAPKINPWESLTQYVLIFSAVWLGINPPAGFVQLIQDAITLLPK